MVRPPLRLATFLLIVATACNSSKEIHLAGSLAVSPSSLDFHQVTVGQSAQLSISLSSLTSTPVTLHSLTLTGPGAAAFTLSASPGTVSGQTTLTVTFTPTAATSYAASLAIASSDPDHPSITVTLAGVGATEDIQVRVQVVDGGVGSVPADGGLSIDFGLDTWGVGPAVWPTILIENLGGASAKLTGFMLTADAGFFFPTPPIVPQTISAEQTRVLPIAFGVPVGVEVTPPQVSGQLTLTFDDPQTPTVTIALSGQVPVSGPPAVCAGIVSAQELDGSIETATVFGQPVPIEPGAEVQLTAYSDDVADGGPSACTSDPSFARGSLRYQWAVTTAPSGSTASPTMPSAPRTSFTPDLVGHYALTLAVTDPNGKSGVPVAPDANVVAFDAAPLEDLTVVAAWPGFAAVDLDLHFVRPGSVPFDPTGDVTALNASATHDWSSTGDPTGNPHFSGDDQGNGDLSERAWLDHPAESCQSDGGCAFGLWIHYYQDNRSLSGSAACTLPGCVEGQSCGCPVGQSCEPNLGGGGACAPEVAPEARVYFKGQITPALEVPIPLAALHLPSPCFMWHAANVIWVGDAGIAQAAADGGLESYWGDHTDETRQCAENDGGWASKPPPQYP